MELSASVLVVDDHDGFRAFARAILEAAGFTVAEAATGAEATETARTVRPGLVLLDIQLPDFDGFEVARRLAAQDDSPVVVLTSTREASDYGAPDHFEPGGRVPAQGSAVGRGTAPVPGREPGVSRRLRAVLIAGAAAAVLFQIVVRYVPGPPSPLIWTIRRPCRWDCLSSWPA